MTAMTRAEFQDACLNEVFPYAKLLAYYDWVNKQLETSLIHGNHTLTLLTQYQNENTALRQEVERLTADLESSRNAVRAREKEYLEACAELDELQATLARVEGDRDLLLQENTNRRCTLGDLAVKMQEQSKQLAQAEQERECLRVLLQNVLDILDNKTGLPCPDKQCDHGEMCRIPQQAQQALQLNPVKSEK